MLGQIQAATGLKAQWQSLVGAPQPAQQAVAAAPCVISHATTPSASVESPLSQSLLQFERARVTYQEQRTIESGGTRSVVATLAYERVVLSQLSSGATVPPQTQDTDGPTSVPAEDAGAPAQSTDAPEPSAPPNAGTVLHHIVINATTLTYRQLTVHVTAASHGVASTPTASPVPQTEPASQSDDHPAVERVDSDAFSALRARSVDRSSETALTLKLTTQEGDVVELVFQQLDLMSRTQLAGVNDSGDRVRAKETTGSSTRYVNMQISGDLSDDEKSAIDDVLQQVVDVANQFFHGDMQAAIARLAEAQIDADQLAEFSLKMSMSRSREVNKLSGDNGQLQQFAHRDSAVSQTLEFLADQQQQLIKAAKTRFDDRSAVTLVKHLLPALIAPPATTADAEKPAAESELPPPLSATTTA